MLTIVGVAMLVVLGIITIIFTETEKFGQASLLLILSVVLAQVCRLTNLVSYINDHWLMSLVYVLIYISIGVAWSFIKWFSYLMRYRDKFLWFKSEFLRNNNLPVNVDVSLTDFQIVDFKKFLISKIGYSYDPLMASISSLQKPKAAAYKNRIIAWMSLWPYSVVGTFLNDPMRRLFRFLFTSFKAAYQKLSDHLFSSYRELK